MTDLLPASAGPRSGPQRSAWPHTAVNLAAVLLVGAGLLTEQGTPPAVLGLGMLALACWIVWAVVPVDPVRYGALLIGALAASLGAGAGRSILIATVVAAIFVVVGDSRSSVAGAAALVVASTLALVLAAAVTRVPALELLGLLGGVVIGTLAAVTRRQRRTAALRALETEREAQRSRLLADRSAVARDIHDVLAHSLGGLVLQLDAIGALLEHGRTGEAAARVEQARGLAGDGLTEARRAVDALRLPESGAPPRADAPPPTALADLVATHRALGAQAQVEGDPDLNGLDDAHRVALVRALQEALSNARRHAPGAVSRIRVVREVGLLHLTVETPDAAPDIAAPDIAAPDVAAPAARPGGGNGLRGMDERFEALGDASSVRAAADGGRFVVDARVALR